MKRPLIFWLLLGGALITLGIILFLIAMSSVGWNFTAFDGDMYETKTHTLKGDVTNITIDTLTTDITILPLNAGEARVETCQNSKVTYTVSLSENGTLSITTTDERKWYDHIFSFTREYITIYLPEGTYGSLGIDNTTGDVRVAKEFTFGNIDVSITTGDVYISASSLTNIGISTTTGDITLSGCTADSITLQNTTGDTELNDISCQSLSSIGTTGDLEMKRVIVATTMQIERDTGDVEFEACDAAYITIKTTTGDIEGSLLTGKVFHASASTGKVRVPQNTTGGGECKLSATTGDITIHIKQ